MMDFEKNTQNEDIAQGECLLNKGVEAILNNLYEHASDNISKALKLFIKHKSSENSSACLSLLGLIEYSIDKSRYLKALTYVNDAKYLANYTKSKTAKLVNEFVLGEIDFSEKNHEVALLHFKSANVLANCDNNYGLKIIIEKRISQIESNKTDSTKQRDPLVALLKIGQTVAAETNIDTLLEVIAEETKSAIQADRCSVFLLDKVKHELWSKVALGMDKQEIRFPADKGLAGHVVRTGETINIKNAYVDERFNKEIDLKTGYKTTTILCMPIKNLNQEIIGAFQVLNKINGEFSEQDEDLLVAIGSSAGIALENAQLFKKQEELYTEQKMLFDSFIDTLATSIDARDKITAGHSTRVKLYSGLISRQMELDEDYIEAIEKAAILHDIGKIGIKDSVLQKEGKLTDEEYQHIQEHVSITFNILKKIHMTEEFKMVNEIASSHHEKFDGSGYYRKLKGEDIPLGGRILAVSDVFDAITSKRHYRDKMPIINVINILLKDCNAHFDPNIVDAFLSIPSDKLVNVFLTEIGQNLNEDSKKLLEKYCLKDIYRLTTQVEYDNLTDEEKTFINIFNDCYNAKTLEEKAINA